MSIFGNLELEDIVQVNDKTRLSAAKTFVAKGAAAITLVKIEPEAGAGYITVSGVGLTSKDWWLDWEYSTPGTKTVTLEVTTNAAPQTFTKTISVLSVAQDGLFSNDKDLMIYEADILKWVPAGRNSFLNVHRKAKNLIVDWLYSQRITKNDGAVLTSSDIKVTENIKLLSIYWTLALIFEGISNKTDDVFNMKSKTYYDLVLQKKNSGLIEADFDGDAVVEDHEKSDMRSYRMVRR